MVELVFIAQPNIMVEEDLLMMRERLLAMAARRVGIDSISVTPGFRACRCHAALTSAHGTVLSSSPEISSSGCPRPEIS